jgi:hypothetical protein
MDEIFFIDAVVGFALNSPIMLSGLRKENNLSMILAMVRN